MDILISCADRAPFFTRQNIPYLEVHHIRKLSDEGPNHLAWVATLCPNCHRRAHFSKDSAEFNLKLASQIQIKEENQSDLRPS